MNSIIISVINDLATDQRVHRLTGTLLRQGFRVCLVGRKLPGSLPVDLDQVMDQSATLAPGNASDVVAGNVSIAKVNHSEKDMIRLRRFRMLFKRGPLFYAFYNVRLFFFLTLRRRPAMLISVDLDTLAANYLVSVLRRIPLLYDSHEYFTEVPELIDRPCVKRIWERIESAILPRLKTGIAVSESIASIYWEKYGVAFTAIRNVPVSATPETLPELQDTYPSTYKIIYQGALNQGRGIELMIEAMRYIPDTVLFIVGDGDIRIDLQSQVHRLKLTDRVVFPGRIPPKRLARITAQCDLGFSLEEDSGLNYRLALPNKVFDYIQSRVPVLCSDLPEMSSLVENYKVGEVCRERTPEALAGQVQKMLKNEKKRELWRGNLDRAANELCWELEERKLIDVLNELLRSRAKGA